MTDVSKRGYHISAIPKGKVGELSKVLEEVMEAIDAEKQGCKLMVLHELSDVIGAIDCYLTAIHSSIGIEDLAVMAQITQRAFQNGDRK